MKLSIITINFNNPEGLERTIQSVCNQTMHPYEYIIVDGGSTKGDIEIIKSFEDHITKWVSEPDGGIYAAINKGARLATGDYILYLNSGDTLYSKNVCKEIFLMKYDEDFIEGRICQGGKFSKPNLKYTLASFIYSHNPYHQASLIKRNLIIHNPYDETFRIAGDLDFNIRNLVIKGCSYRPIEIVISNYEVGGRSVFIAHQDEIERCFSYFPKAVLDDYQEMMWKIRFPAYILIPFVKKITELCVRFKNKNFK